jgi:hypothetical protein
VRKADIKAGIFMILFGVFVFWYSSRYAEVVINIYGPNFFPQFLSIVICICGVILIVHAKRGKAPEKEEKIDRKGFVRMAVSIGICIGYLLLMQVVGFAIGSFVFLFVMMTFLRQQGVTKRIVSSIAASMLVWAIFRYFLVIPLPTGLWEFTF